MRVVTLDFETYYSTEYSLSKMSPVEYILDKRFECTGLAVKYGKSDAFWIEGDKVQEFFDGLDPSDIMAVSHNALFDMCICSFRYGWIPKVMVDTLGVSRSLLGAFLRSLSLNSVAGHLGLGAKTGALANVRNMRLNEIRAHPKLYLDFIAYGLNDADLCYGIFEKLVKSGQFPAVEIAVMDAVLRCAVEPKFVVNQNVLHQSLNIIKTQKEQTLAAAMLLGADDKKTLMSNDQFAELLRTHGVDPPTKISGLTGKETYAFAKSDQEFIDLLEHPNIAVQTIVGARLGHKSTIEESRHERFIKIANLQWPKTKITSGGNLSLMPMPLRYGGAHTHRLSGDWKLNCMHPDVEVLTPSGWQRVEDWQATTPIMQWWPGGGLTWEKSANKIEKEDTELVWFDSPFVKGGFTPDHRMASVSRDTGKMKDVPAGDVLGRELKQVPVSGLYRGGTSELSPRQVRILVALAADGSTLYSGDTRVKGKPRPAKKTNGWQFGFHKQRKALRLYDLLDTEGIKFTYNTIGSRHCFSIREINTPHWMKKGFGDWLLDLKPASMDAFLDELVYWDGFANSKNGNTTFCTSKYEEAMWVQTIAHLRGQPCTIRKYEKVTSFGNTTQYYVYFRSGKWSSIAKNKSVKKPYSGKVYCPQVSSTYILVRYGDGVFVTGNCQNLGRTSQLRNSLVAPEGYVVVAGDESQVEARFVCTLCGQEDMRQQFERGEDVYKLFAVVLFNTPYEQISKIQRFIAKQCILGLGYNLGKDKFTKSIPILAWNQLQMRMPYTEAEGAHAVNTYRTLNRFITATWKLLNTQGIHALHTGNEWRWGPVIFRKEEIVLPNGMKLHYHNLRQVQGGKFGTEWVFEYGHKTKRCYGGMLLENIVQALARIVVMEAAVRIRMRLAKLGIQLALQVHDELVFVVKKEHEAITRKVLEFELRKRPEWLPNVPLDCEVASGPSYGDAK